MVKQQTLILDLKKNIVYPADGSNIFIHSTSETNFFIYPATGQTFSCIRPPVTISHASGKRKQFLMHPATGNTHISGQWDQLTHRSRHWEELPHISGHREHFCHTSGHRDKLTLSSGHWD